MAHLFSALVCAVIILMSAVTANAQSVNNHRQPIVDRPFKIVSAVLIGATIYDLEATFAALDRCPQSKRCYEGNPIQRPFVAGGRFTAYTANAIIDAGVLHLAYSMKASRRFSKIWWALPAGAIVGHAIGGTLNITLIKSWQ